MGIEALLGPATRLLVGFFHSETFLRFLRQTTGIQGLLPDPTMWGGGVHQTARGGYLHVHKDFSKHPVYNGFKRKVNVFLYLNGDWADDFGGDLELWMKANDTFRCARRIRSVANRLVVFVMSPKSWHGHPWPLRTPPSRTRRSLALYYYTVSTEITQEESTGAILPMPCSYIDVQRVMVM